MSLLTGQRLIKMNITNINFINYIPKFMHGSLVTLNDCYIDVSRYYDTKLYFKYYNQTTTDDTRYLIKQYEFMKEYMITSKADKFIENAYLNGTTVTVSWVLKNLNLESFKGDNLIILESLDIYLLELDNKLNDVLSALSKNFKHVYILANPMNLEVLKKYNYKNIDYIEYYIKLSKERLDKIGNKDDIDNRTLIRHEMLIDKYKEHYLYNSRLEYINTLKFKSHAFCRIGTYFNGTQLYMENIGKLIFEYLYMNRNLDYYNYNRVGDDGIHYYMKLIELDDKENHLNLIGYTNIIKEKLLFNDNDLLLKLIEDVK